MASPRLSVPSASTSWRASNGSDSSSGPAPHGLSRSMASRRTSWWSRCRSAEGFQPWSRWISALTRTPEVRAEWTASSSGRSRATTEDGSTADQCAVPPSGVAGEAGSAGELVVVQEAGDDPHDVVGSLDVHPVARPRAGHELVARPGDGIGDGLRLPGRGEQVLLAHE